jgi:hypothetical protein
VGVWEAVEFGTDDYREDRNELAALLHAMPEEMQAGAEEAIKRVRAEAESASGKKLHYLHTDRGGEILSSDFSDYCDETGCDAN